VHSGAAEVAPLTQAEMMFARRLTLPGSGIAVRFTVEAISPPATAGTTVEGRRDPSLDWPGEQPSWRAVDNELLLPRAVCIKGVVAGLKNCVTAAMVATVVTRSCRRSCTTEYAADIIDRDEGGGCSSVRPFHCSGYCHP